MISYRCPRADLGCAADFPSSGDLDSHLRWLHGYRRSARYLAALRPLRWRPVGSVPAAAAVAAGAGGFRPQASTGAARARVGGRRRARR